MSESTPEDIANSAANAEPGPDALAETPDAMSVGAGLEGDSGASALQNAEDAVAPVMSERARRLMKLPVKVVVYLAQKKIEVEQLLAISPGALITFNKPCEDLLDLYVNNHKYCRGEAVKIGEKFGIKISEVGVVDVRESPILV